MEGVASSFDEAAPRHERRGGDASSANEAATTQNEVRKSRYDVRRLTGAQQGPQGGRQAHQQRGRGGKTSCLPRLRKTPRGAKVAHMTWCGGVVRGGLVRSGSPKGLRQRQQRVRCRGRGERERRASPRRW
ncbi:hypothetical protein MRX96_014649 [Rhipicephalus microplus]